jgi:CRISPR system Cascade subunit CasB
MTRPPETADDTKPSRAAQRRSLIGRLAHAMELGASSSGRAGFSTGDLAELRRIDPAQPYTPALWRTLIAYDIDDGWGDGTLRETLEERWAALLMGMAYTVGLHDPSLGLGTALAEAGWSETRFVRLMESRDKRLTEEIRRVAQYLSAKSQPANWAQVAGLVLDQDSDWAERQRRKIARDYYRRLNHKEADN